MAAESHTPEGPEADQASGPAPAPDEVSVDAEVVPESAPDGGAAAPADSEKVGELTADLQRLSAEFANYRKRTAKDVVEARAAGKAAVVGELLVVLDDLERARSHGDLDTGPLKVFADKLNSVLTAQGLEPFGAEGDEFDPAIHQAVSHEGDGADPVVGAVMRQGYRVGGKVIREAMVGVVDRASAGDDNDNDNDDQDQTSGVDA
ncbi:nucleotide exchange factor GrpE [Tsukamurella sp. 8F]|uniref:nucleotide exchange factor GrpE n=1 Tax=unclassified Tsukamurella TaxID=2633480 RepID=UPI0023B9D1FB|nr:MULTISPECIES: nucleotide exchange factor GrpE [unclassified Tsukamurella]MDF0528534.1 nucleotide exchange factor GrpE [Tsukamurella sp. 8J]MDF0586360.1 nucleotide exchange factor GrpE [Tsukamurella sp. 8F]